MRKKTKKKETVDTATNIALANVSTDVVSRYGSGIKEHYVAYGGVDNEAGGRLLKRSLKGISKYKVNAENQQSNLKAQAGFAAEVKETARRRAEEAIKGENPKTIRTDDIPGDVNDEFYDITWKVGSDGKPMPNDSIQMKFVGKTPHDAVGRMLGKDFQKYFGKDCKMMVSSDFYDAMQEDLSKRIDVLKKQIEALEKSGKVDVAAQKRAILEKCKQLKKNLVKSSVSNEAAMEARTSPKTSTAKDIVKLAHRAGLEQAKNGAVLGGSISFVRNVIEYFKGEKTAKEAAVSVVGDTTSAAALSYATAFAGSGIKGMMQNAKSSIVRSASKTNLPAIIVTSTLEIGKTLTKYFRGQINGVQCLEELGEKGCGMACSSMGMALGQLAIPVPVVGAAIGSMLGYVLSSTSYRVLLNSLKNAELSRKERIRIEKECEEAIALIRKCRAELQIEIEKYFKDEIQFFNVAFASIKQCLEIDDIDGYISGTNEMICHLGGTPQYRNKAEFDALMADSTKPLTL